ncbi:MAG: biotin/lipoyl-binding protein [Pelagibacteraceae bacterium]|jgi:pyruvate dehydrogenase E1 component|nr:biotin/lipoyl-binding protein [Pelagibacteraceae bacterium]
MATEITVPDIGDFNNVEIIEIQIKPGDIIKEDDSIVTLESNISSMEVPASIAGKISELKVKIGDRVSKGSVLALIESGEKIKEEPIKQKEKKDEKILPETEKIIKEAESTIIKKSKKPTIQEYEISDILSAVDSIYRIEKKKNKIVKKNGSTDKDDVLILNNQAKTNKGEILVLDKMVE